MREIRSADVELRSHVVREFVNVNIFVANLLIHSIVGSVGRESVPLLEILFVAFHLHIARVGTHFELVHLVGVISLVRKGKVLVVRLSHVDDSLIDSVDEMHGWLVCLSIDIDA